jgi:3D (Asp-Asp-Asp) domain-containing protein
MKNKNKQKSIILSIIISYALLVATGLIGATHLYLKRIETKNEKRLATQNQINSPNDLQGVKQTNNISIDKSSNDSISKTDENISVSSQSPTSSTSSAPSTALTTPNPATSLADTGLNTKLKEKLNAKPTVSTPSKKAKVTEKEKQTNPTKPKATNVANVTSGSTKPLNLVENKGLDKKDNNQEVGKKAESKFSSLIAWISSPLSNLKDRQQKPVLKAQKTNPNPEINQKTKATSLVAKNKNNKVTSHQKSNGKTKKMLARVTVYWAYGSGTDKWSAKKQSSTGTKLECGKHIAVDPKVIPYGSKVELQKNGQEVLVKAVDTGSAVKKRKAAIAMAKTDEERKAPVIDLFFEKKSDALNYAKSNPHYQWVDVHIPPMVSASSTSSSSPSSPPESKKLAN